LTESLAELHDDGSALVAYILSSFCVPEGN
jgi:hypothetical protein